MECVGFRGAEFKVFGPEQQQELVKLDAGSGQLEKRSGLTVGSERRSH